MELGPKRYPKGPGRRPEFRCWLHFRRSRLRRWRIEEADFNAATAVVAAEETWLKPLVADFEAFYAAVGRMPPKRKGQKVVLDVGGAELRWVVENPDMVFYKGRWWRLKRLCESIGIGYHAVRRRLDRNWDMLEALHRPTKRPRESD